MKKIKVNIKKFFVIFFISFLMLGALVFVNYNFIPASKNNSISNFFKKNYKYTLSYNDNLFIKIFEDINEIKNTIVEDVGLKKVLISRINLIQNEYEILNYIFAKQFNLVQEPSESISSYNCKLAIKVLKFILKEKKIYCNQNSYDQYNVIVVSANKINNFDTNKKFIDLINSSVGKARKKLIFFDDSYFLKLNIFYESKKNIDIYSKANNFKFEIENYPKKFIQSNNLKNKIYKKNKNELIEINFNNFLNDYQLFCTIEKINLSQCKSIVNFYFAVGYNKIISDSNELKKLTNFIIVNYEEPNFKQNIKNISFIYDNDLMISKKKIAQLNSMDFVFYKFNSNIPLSFDEIRIDTNHLIKIILVFFFFSLILSIVIFLLSIKY